MTKERNRERIFSTFHVRSVCYGVLCLCDLISDYFLWKFSGFIMPPPNLPRWRRYLTVEPVVLFYTFGIFMSLPVLTQYVYFRVSQYKGFPYNVSETSEKGCNVDAGVNSSLTDLEKEVQIL